MPQCESPESFIQGIFETYSQDFPLQVITAQAF